MSNARPIALMAALIAAAALVLVLYRGSTPPPASQQVAEAGPPAAQPARAGDSRGPSRRDYARPTLAAADTPVDRVAYLRDRYGAHIDNPYVQIKMLEELIRYFQEHEPERWREALLALVREAFPELYDQIAALLQKRLDYQAWMKDNRARLRGMDAGQRRQALWEARERLFGADAADKIWASERRHQAVADALATIDAHQGATLSDKLTMYKQSLADVYEDRVDGYLQRHRHEAMNQFLGLESVQRELSRMSAGERSQSLREIREGMGLDEDALARWDELDRKRDQRWERGLAYMEERAALAERHAGDELEAQLDALRARYFGAEAEIIAREEASGFFRFDRPRRWGQN